MAHFARWKGWASQRCLSYLESREAITGFIRLTVCLGALLLLMALWWHPKPNVNSALRSFVQWELNNGCNCVKKVRGVRSNVDDFSPLGTLDSMYFVGTCTCTFKLQVALMIRTDNLYLLRLVGFVYSRIFHICIRMHLIMKTFPHLCTKS